MRILRYLLALLALSGLVVSVLALRVHLQDPNAAPPCAVSEHWDCGAVNHSRFAVFPPRGFEEDVSSKGHLPVAAGGIVAYLGIALLVLFKRDFLTFELTQIAFGFALLLTFLEKYVLEKWCIYCVWSQSILAVMLVLAAVNLYLARRKGLHIRSRGIKSAELPACIARR